MNIGLSPHISQPAQCFNIFIAPRYKYDWKIEEAQKNILRTHTTAVSARMLYKLAQQVSGTRDLHSFQLHDHLAGLNIIKNGGPIEHCRKRN